ncbi:TIM23 translocase complex subunit Tim44 [Schizosaccharomyces octosporus yFS286]|uniref:Mitochondrial import inner membrane translocase subunit TIM44 n=1 Tax=Schizosaccharomyces octosporus (strain yFS286) TaxID=483514 RepID=S9Q677_SCHOY|nr:TIM23 translocase complex subunit Tim44 [Schizosaccharomyces octosporus yFS286]EPX75118.1 TIM23 translocase complex subunit Tim44 [Schizosaccharomyces octosporus yFS286]
MIVSRRMVRGRYGSKLLERSLQTSASNRNAGPQSPIKVFMDTFRSELKKSQDFQNSVKALQDSSGNLGESDAFKRARDAYSKARQGTSVASKTIGKAGSALGSGAHKAWESAPMRFSRKVIAGTTDSVTSGVDKATQPVRKTALYKTVKSTMSDGSTSSRYGFYADKEQRKKLREEFEKKTHMFGRSAKIQPNDDVQSVVVHTNPSWKNKVDQITSESKFVRKLQEFRRIYEESEHPIISSIRDLADSISGTWSRMFSETEASQVMTRFKEIDPAFNLEHFLQYLREYVVPEVTEAYVKGDKEVLRTWFSEAPFSVYETTTKEYAKHGIVSVGRILDIRGVDIMSQRLLQPSNVPVLVVTFRTQEVHMFKNALSGELVAGREDRIQQCTYAAVLTRIEEDLDNKETRGWCIVDFARARAVDYF